MNKVMETLPSLYLDLTACRQGLNGSQQRHGGSLEWEKDEFDHIVDLQVRSQEQDPEKRRRFIKLMILELIISSYRYEANFCCLEEIKYFIKFANQNVFSDAKFLAVA